MWAGWATWWPLSSYLTSPLLTSFTSGARISLLFHPCAPLTLPQPLFIFPHTWNNVPTDAPNLTASAQTGSLTVASEIARSHHHNEPLTPYSVPLSFISLIITRNYIMYLHFWSISPTRTSMRARTSPCLWFIQTLECQLAQLGTNQSVLSKWIKTFHQQFLETSTVQHQVLYTLTGRQLCIQALITS